MTPDKRSVVLTECKNIQDRTSRIAYALRNGIQMTQKMASRSPFCTTRLSAYIFKLRQAGMQITTKHKRVTASDGCPANVGVYVYEKP